MDTSSDVEASDANDEICPLCQGAGFVRVEVPLEHPDFGKAFPCECTNRELDEHKLERLLRYSNLGSLTRLSFDNIVSQGRSQEPANQKRFERCLELAKGFADNPDGWLVFLGPSGCGKTHLAAAIANHRIKAGHQAFFIAVPDLLDHLRATYGPESSVSYDDLFEQMRNSPLLFLDDLGAQSSTPWAKEKLYQLINHRYNSRLPTVITTSQALEELDERINTRLSDPALSQICQVEEPAGPIFQNIGGMALEQLSQMTFDTLRLQGLNGEVRRNLEEAFRIARKFAETPEGWLVFIGGHGCGKTHLASAITNYRLRSGQPVVFAVVPELLDELRSTIGSDKPDSYTREFEQIKKAPLLILDDLGAQSSTPWAQEKLYQLLNYRYNSKAPTVITTVFSLDEMESRISSRMVDPRLSLVFNIRAPDYRGDIHPVSKSSRTSTRSKRRRSS
jgi:DNA replication protein DnaC